MNTIPTPATDAQFPNHRAYPDTHSVVIEIGLMRDLERKLYVARKALIEIRDTGIMHSGWTEKINETLKTTEL